MDLITAEERDGLFVSFRREALHLEMRDSYGTEAEIPHMAKWAAGEPDDLEWLRPWCDRVEAAVAAGKSFRRASIVGEPLSDYQRWSHSMTGRHVDAGEDCRWVPRRLVSGIAVPGNDFWLFDDQIALFIVFAGNGKVVERQRSIDPAVVRLCRSAFDAVWAHAIPHREYKPT
jgi:hypothetical protein